MKFDIKKLRDVKTPSRSYTAAAGYDFYVPSNFEYLPTLYPAPDGINMIKWESKTISPNTSLLIPSGLMIKMQKNHALRFENKSSMALLGLIVGATIVDHDYQGEIHLHVWNVSKQDVTVKCGQKLVQGIFFSTINVELNEIKQSQRLFETASARASNGFGSTNGIHK
jgi:deoxyuridine 5'-triphosphate nucleotidohydrolase